MMIPLLRAAIGLLLVLVPMTRASAREILDPFPNMAASYLLYLDGEMLWAHQPERLLPPASLTKVMTALLVLENSKPDEIVTVSRDAVNETGTRIGLKRGERMLARNLLAAALMQSANDACHALAEHVAGTERLFVALMNRRALALKLPQTHFTNVCGHDHREHYSSARDLSILARNAMKYELFRTLVSTVQMSVETVDRERTFHLANINQLVGRYPGAIGVKTGSTPKAGNCLIALAQRNATAVMLVLLNAPDRWWSAVAMLDRAFTLPPRLR